MASPTKFNPSLFASEMQTRTRKKNNFDKFESDLPDPRGPPVRSSFFNVGDFIGRLSGLNPFGRAVQDGDIVWLFDNTAFRPHQAAPWEAEFVAAVFDPQVKCKTVDIVTGIAKSVGLAEDAEECKTIEERLMPFLWELKTASIVTVQHRGKDLRLAPTNTSGISSSVPKVEGDKKGALVTASAKSVRRVEGMLDMQTHYVGAEGWGFISDIDDTIKITMTSDPAGILRETFVSEPTPVPGMPELYASIASSLPKDTPWFYLSASPYNLYPFLREFRDKHYPQGTMILRDSSWRTISGLLSNLTVGTEEYKVNQMKKIHGWLPKRKMICVGDSTQSDPEAYGEIYRNNPGWVKLILIRKATDVAAFGIDEKNQPERFEKAFEDVPKEAWHVFEDPSECQAILKTVIAKG